MHAVSNALLLRTGHLGFAAGELGLLLGRGSSRIGFLRLPQSCAARCVRSLGLHTGHLGLAFGLFGAERGGLRLFEGGGACGLFHLQLHLAAFSLQPCALGLVPCSSDCGLEAGDLIGALLPLFLERGLEGALFGQLLRFNGLPHHAVTHDHGVSNVDLGLRQRQSSSRGPPRLR